MRILFLQFVRRNTPPFLMVTNSVFRSSLFVSTVFSLFFLTYINNFFMLRWLVTLLLLQLMRLATLLLVHTAIFHPLACSAPSRMENCSLMQSV